MDKTSGGNSVFLLLALIQGPLFPSAVEVQPSANPAPVGSNVTLELSPPAALNSGCWAVGDVLILTWLGAQQAVFQGYEGRASVNGTTGALSLRCVRVADTGVYAVQSSDPLLKATAILTVLEPVSNIRLVANATELVEFNSSVRLSCSSSGSSLSYRLANGSSEVTASDGVQLGDGGSTLTIVHVTRYDQGPFRCNVTNAVSKDISQPLHLNITYGPDRMSLKINGISDISPVLIGSNLTLSCSAQSNPPAKLQWIVKGEVENRTGSELQLHGVQENQSGPYSCLAFNNHTNLYSNITKHITISRTNPLARNVWLFPLLSLVGALL